MTLTTAIVLFFMSSPVADRPPGDIVPAAAASEADAVDIRSALSAFFRGGNCPLPPRLQKKLEKVQKGKKIWLPEAVDAALGNVMTQKATEEAQTLRAAMHSVKVGESEGSTISLLNAVSYDELNVFAFINKERPNLTYATDCSGLLNASLSAKVGISAAQIKSSARQSVTAQKTLLVIYAHLHNPIAAALRPDNMPQRVLGTPQQQLDTIWSLASKLSDEDDTQKFSVPYELVVVAMSKNETSSLQGEARLEAEAGVSAGYASITSSATAAISHSRRMDYAVYKTLKLATSDDLWLTVRYVRALAVDRVAAARLMEPVKKIDGSLQLKVSFPRRVCERTWKRENSNAAVTATWLEGEKSCSLLVSPATNDEFASPGKVSLVPVASPAWKGSEDLKYTASFG